MPSLLLTEITLRSLKSETQTDFWDQSLPNFGVRVGKRTKSFMLKQNNARVVIGSWPTMTIKEAREEARRRLAAPHRPTSHITFKEAVKLYIETYSKRHHKPSTQKETARLLNRFPFDRRLSDVSHTDITNFLSKISPSEANHCYVCLRAFLNWCRDNKYLSETPLNRSRLPHKPSERDYVIPDSHLAKIWAATATPTTYHTLVRLLLLTGQRRGELAAYHPSWLQGDVVTIPAAFTKNKTQHSFAIGPLALSLLQTYSPQPMSGWSKRKRALDKQSVDGWTLHDLRRTFATIHARMGTPPHIIEALLNHKVGTLTPIAKIYNRWNYLNEMRVAMKLYEDHLASFLPSDPATQPTD